MVKTIRELNNYIGQYVRITGIGSGGSAGTFVGKPMMLESSLDLSMKNCIGVTLSSGAGQDNKPISTERFVFHIDSIFEVIGEQGYRDMFKTQAPEPRTEAREEDEKKPRRLAMEAVEAAYATGDWSSEDLCLDRHQARALALSNIAIADEMHVANMLSFLRLGYEGAFELSDEDQAKITAYIRREL